MTYVKAPGGGARCIWNAQRKVPTDQNMRERGRLNRRAEYSPPGGLFFVHVK